MSQNINLINNAIDYAIKTNNAYYNNVPYTIKHLRSKKTLVAFGCGKFFMDAYPYIQNLLSIKYVVDNNSANWGKKIYNILCISPDVLSKMDKADTSVIIFIGNKKPIESQLDTMGFEHFTLDDVQRNMYTEFHDANWFEEHRNDILDGYKLLTDDESKDIFTNKLCKLIAPHLCQKDYIDFQTSPEYFDMPFWKLSDNEGYLDVGAYTGDTISQFIDNVDSYSFIVAYEMDKNIFTVLNENIQNNNYNNVYIKPYGIGISKKEDPNYCQLDEEHYSGKVTLIKMDIEGYESSAINGAINLIKSDLPKLSICVYHRLEDMWELPLKISSINSNYKIYIRHHSPIVWDTVMYCCM